MRLNRIPLALLAATGLVVLLCTGSASALSTGNGGWTWQDPLPHGATYQGAHFTTPTRGWLVTDNCILRTTNGGATVNVQANHNVRLKDITFANSRRGWAVGWPAGANGRVIIYRTTNGGADWTRVRLDVRGRLNAVAFANANVGWAVGGRPGADGMRSLILKTVDGGATWFRQRAGNVSELTDVSVTGPSRGWVAGGTRLRRTTNGGETWGAVGPESYPDTVDFVSSLVGWAASGDKVYRSGDGGETWTQQFDYGLDPGWINGLAFADELHGWFVGNSGAINATVDGGATWAVRGSASDRAYHCVCAVTPAAGVVAGDGGALGRSLDNGVTWSWQPQSAGGFTGWCSAVDFANTTTGWVTGVTASSALAPASTTILHTADAGATWSTQAPGTAQALLDVDFVDANNGWAVGAGGTIIHTGNGGGAWGPQASGTTADLRGVCFSDGLNGWAVGVALDGPASTTGPVVRHTADGGATWTAQSSADESFVWGGLCGVAFADALHGWAVGWTYSDGMGEPAVIYGTGDGGATWTKQLSYVPPVTHSSGTAVLHSVHAIDASRAVAVGYADDNDQMLPLVYRTTNGGATWTKCTVPTSWDAWNVGLSDVAFRGASRGWAVGLDGIMLRTTDGGRTWTKLRSGVGGDLNGVCFASLRRGWAVGDFAAILRTTTGGLAP
jgi:photosystem II stability/assembly factor-like uncharacterized protein